MKAVTFPMKLTGALILIRDSKINLPRPVLMLNIKS